VTAPAYQFQIPLSFLGAELGFARWREHPEQITGFYARILEGEVPNYQCTHVSTVI